jgi:hypothetical protein
MACETFGASTARTIATAETALMMDHSDGRLLIIPISTLA